MMLVGSSAHVKRTTHLHGVTGSEPLNDTEAQRAVAHLTGTEISDIIAHLWFLLIGLSGTVLKDKVKWMGDIMNLP